MNDQITSEEIDEMIAELKASGWKPKTSVIWCNPSGKLYLGPVGAWNVMKRAQNDKRHGVTA